MESWVDEGPGSSEQAAFASSNAVASIHPLRPTTSSRSSVMCAGGPPKPINPIRSHSRAITRSGAAGRFILREHVEVDDCRLVVRTRVTGRGAGSGLETDREFGYLYAISDGRATRFHLYDSAE